MTNGSERTPWGQVAAALGAGRDPESPAPAVPAGWDRLRDALTGAGPSRAAEKPVVEDPAEAAPAVPGGWAQLRGALRAGGPSPASPAPASATSLLDPPGTAETTEPAEHAETAEPTEPSEPAGAAEPTGGAEPTGTGGGDDGGDTDGAGEDRRRAGPLGSLGRAWSTRTGKATVAVAAAAAVAAGVVVATTGGGGGLPAADAFSVNGKAVPLTQFNNELTVRQTLYGIQPPAPSDTAKYNAYLTSAAQAEAVSVLLDQIAPRQGVTVSAQTAQASLSQAINTQYGGDQSKFAQALGAAGLNQDQVLAEITHNLVYQKLFAKIVGSPKVSTAQIQQYFAQHKAQLAEPETRQISHIVVATQASAESLLKQLRSGASFATLASSQSLDTSTKANGGQLGLYAKDDLQVAFANAAFSARVDQPFGPVKDSSGDWDIGVVTAIHPAAAAQLTATTSTAIKTVLIDQQEANTWDSWLGRQIKAAHIVYAARYRPANPDAPPPIPIPQLTGETLAGVGAAGGTATSSGTGSSGAGSAGAGTSTGAAPSGSSGSGG